MGICYVFLWCMKLNKSTIIPLLKIITLYMQDVLLGIQVFVVLNGMKFLTSSQSLARRITFSSCQFRRYFSTSPVTAQGDFSTPVI